MSAINKMAAISGREEGSGPKQRCCLRTLIAGDNVVMSPALIAALRKRSTSELRKYVLLVWACAVNVASRDKTQKGN